MKTKTDRNYKDSVFTTLFGYEKRNLLELYNAIKNTNYGIDTDIQITTLSDVLFRERYNDISFVIDGKIVVLIEHQSTVNYSIPLRMLIYMARTYENLTKEKDIYRKSIIHIPKPEFIVLYNGNENLPDKQVLKLSDMYIDSGKDSINLELVVKILNINKGRNEDISQRSVLLKDYGIFVYLVKENTKTMPRDVAICKAIDDCIGSNVLKRFLEEHSSEVRNMLNVAKWDWDEELAVRYEEGIAVGRAEGVVAGEAKGIARGKLEGIFQTAKAMLSKGMNASLISEITGLSKDEIERI